MYQNDQFAYFLTVQNIESPDALKLMRMMRDPKYFDGALFPDYTAEDSQLKRIFFDCGNRGSIDEISRDEVDQIMNSIAKTFPKARFHLLADDIDNPDLQYQICTQGDMYQYSQRQAFMPKLSTPVPFEHRSVVQSLFSEKDYHNEFLYHTDFDLLYQQKMALLQAREQNAALSPETIDGLVNFLDFIGDWAEHEGVFVYPNLEEKEKNKLDQVISSAETRTGSPSPAQKREITNEID